MKYSILFIIAILLAANASAIFISNRPTESEYHPDFETQVAPNLCYFEMGEGIVCKNVIQVDGGFGRARFENENVCYRGYGLQGDNLKCSQLVLPPASSFQTNKFGGIEEKPTLLEKQEPQLSRITRGGLKITGHPGKTFWNYKRRAEAQYITPTIVSWD